jgi:hypothetical protein
VRIFNTSEGEHVVSVRPISDDGNGSGNGDTGNGDAGAGGEDAGPEV